MWEDDEPILFGSGSLDYLFILWQRNQILQPNIIPLVSAQVTKMSHQNGLSLPDPILVGG